MFGMPAVVILGITADVADVEIIADFLAIATLIISEFIVEVAYGVEVLRSMALDGPSGLRAELEASDWATVMTDLEFALSTPLRDSFLSW